LVEDQYQNNQGAPFPPNQMRKQGSQPLKDNHHQMGVKAEAASNINEMRMKAMNEGRSSMPRYSQSQQEMFDHGYDQRNFPKVRNEYGMQRHSSRSGPNQMGKYEYPRHGNIKSSLDSDLSRVPLVGSYSQSQNRMGHVSGSNIEYQEVPHNNRNMGQYMGRGDFPSYVMKGDHQSEFNGNHLFI